MLRCISKRFPCLLCAIMCAFCLSAPCLAVDSGSVASGIELRMVNINDATCVISVKDGKAAAAVDVSGKKGADKCKIVLKIQEQNGNRWTTVESWTVTKNGRNAFVGKSVQAESGKTYRAQATVTVWMDGVAESKTITTNGKKA